MRVLGIDTALRTTGVGVVESRGSRLTAVEFGTLRTPAGRPVSECLRRLHLGLLELIERAAPEAASIEGAFFCRNVATAMVLGQARGVAIAACACRGVPIYEYAPRRVKQAVVGYGQADKTQVAHMVARMLNLEGEIQADAADALALAICHLHGHTGYAALQAEPL